MSLSGPGVTASFAYDAVGRRRQKTVNGVTTAFLYDGLDVVQELNGSTPVANLLTGLGIDEVLTRTDAVGAQGFLSDGLGSTLALTDPSGVVLTEYTYEPFGKTSVTGAASTNAFRYTGREDDGTGLYYYRARYYHPGLQRFISQDPIGFAGGDVNLYAYVRNSPLQFIDPYGLSKFDKFYGLPKKFWNWFHRHPDMKHLKGPDGQVSKDVAEQYKREWDDLGRPGPDSKGKQGGSVDPGLLPDLIPWPLWLTPSDLGSHPCEMPGGPPCGPEEPPQPDGCK